jgi:hypothetical protein
MIGREFSHHRIVGKLSGEMGAVYKVRDIALSRRVDRKILVHHF